MAAILPQDQCTLPITLGEVEILIHELYQPGFPQRVSGIQETLHTLQKSAHGWQLANSLLESRDEKIKFFGALTFIVKLNSDSESLSAADAEILLSRLIGWLVRCVDESVSPLVIRKLCSTLVVYFLHFSSSWTRCVQHIIYSLYTREFVPARTREQAFSVSVLVQTLPAEKVSAALWFSITLADEVGKTDANHIKHHKFHEQLKLNIDDVVVLIARGLTSSSLGEAPITKLRQESMKCFQSWVLYSHRAFIDAAVILEPLKSLTRPAITCIVEDEMYEVTVELFSDILANYPKFFNDEDFRLLFALFSSDWARERYDRLVRGDFAHDSLQYGHLMIAFGDATVQELARNTDITSQNFLSALEGLLSADGFIVAEDQIFVPALEFWSTFVEVMIDSLYSEGGIGSTLADPSGHLPDPKDPETTSIDLYQATGSWLPTALSHVMQVIERCWRKIRFPPPEVFESWDSVDRAGFLDARNDVADLLESSCTLTGSSLFSMFAKITLRSLEEAAWEELEASLFCLGAFADCISDGDLCDNILGGVFGSALFGTLADAAIHIPTRTRQAALTFIGQYNNYFLRHSEYLPNTLTFLFKALRSPLLSSAASKSIQSLCFSCRHSLTDGLTAFIQHYEEYTPSSSPDALVKERILGAIAAIIQSLPTENEKVLPVARLLQFVEVDFEKCLGLLTIGNNDEAEELGLETLRSLLSIAKGFQAPTDAPLDLENTTNTDIMAEFWTNGDGVVIQSHIQNIIEKLMIKMSYNSDIVEAACSIFRAGFTERPPGPFVFTSSSVVDFLIRTNLTSPRLGVFITTACSLVSSYAVSTIGGFNNVIPRLLSWILIIIRNLQEPTYDPEIAQAGIDFVFRLLPRHVEILMAQPPASLEYFFMFTLRALGGRDPLPKFAAADFWSSFISLANLPEPLQASINNSVMHLGPSLAQALVHNISGNAARSELDKVSDPLKKLVARQVHAKSWLQSAFIAENPTGDQLNATDKRLILQKIVNLRGAKQTNQVVKDFWLACRGSNFAYAS